MVKVAVIGGTSSEYPGIKYSRQSLSQILTSIPIDVGREVIDAIVKRGNHEVTIMSRKVNLHLSMWTSLTSWHKIGWASRRPTIRDPMGHGRLH